MYDNTKSPEYNQAIETLSKFDEQLFAYTEEFGLDFAPDEETEDDFDGWPYLNIMDLCWIKAYDDGKLYFRFVDETGRPKRNEFPVHFQTVVDYLSAQTKVKPTPTLRIKELVM